MLIDFVPDGNLYPFVPSERLYPADARRLPRSRLVLPSRPAATGDGTISGYACRFR